VTLYLTSYSEWTDFADIATFIAWDVYSSCPSYNASNEQQAVIDAFTAIGYPPEYTSLIPCP
jgi:hypothetical protein